MLQLRMPLTVVWIKPWSQLSSCRSRASCLRFACSLSWACTNVPCCTRVSWFPGCTSLPLRRPPSTHLCTAGRIAGSRAKWSNSPRVCSRAIHARLKIVEKEVHPHTQQKFKNVHSVEKNNRFEARILELVLYLHNVVLCSTLAKACQTAFTLPLHNIHCIMPPNILISLLMLEPAGVRASGRPYTIFLFSGTFGQKIV